MIVTILQVIFTLEEWYMCFFYFIFQNAMVCHKAMATIAGLFNFRSTQKWKVTQKYGSKNTINTNKQIILNTEITSYTQPILSYVNVTKLKWSNKLETYNLVSWLDVEANHFTDYYRFNFNMKIFIDSLKDKSKKSLAIFLQTYKGNFIMSMLFFVFFHLGIRSKQYQACLFALTNGIMYLIFAFGYLGRSE